MHDGYSGQIQFRDNLMHDGYSEQFGTIHGGYSEQFSAWRLFRTIQCMMVIRYNLMHDGYSE